MRARDALDAARAAAPLRPAPDAVLLDTTELDAETAFRAGNGRSREATRIAAIAAVQPYANVRTARSRIARAS